MKLTTAEELEAALRVAAEEADDEGITSREAAKRLRKPLRALIAEFADEWIDEKLITRLRELRAAKRRAEDRQYQLVGFKPPRSFVLPDGRTMEWAKASAYALKKGRSVVFQKHKDYHHPAVQRFDRAIEFMEKVKADHPRVTWERAIQVAPVSPEAKKT